MASCTAPSRWARRPRTWPSATASSREEQDAFALRVAPARGRRARRRAASPTRSSPSTVPQHKGEPVDRRRATRVRAPTPRSSSSRSCGRPSARAARVTAGNSSPLNDGAAALLLASERGGARRWGSSRSRADRGDRRGRRRARADGHRPGAGHAQGALARRPDDRRPRSGRAQRGVRGPGARLHARAGHRPASASTSTAARSRSAIRSAASGARLIGTLAHELRRRGGRYGLAAMCIGVGQGIASVIEAWPGHESAAP